MSDSVVVRTQKEASGKTRKRSEYRTLYGSKAITETAALVTKCVADFVKYNETMDKYVTAGIFKNRAEAFTGNVDGLRLVPPQGSTELAKLRKMCRMAVLRPEVIVDAVKLARIANFLVTMIGEDNLLVTRERIKQEQVSDQQE